MKAVFLCNDLSCVSRVYEKAFIDQYPQYTKDSFLEANPGEVEVIFSTWGMPSFTREEIRQYLPNLKAIFYAAGTVKKFALPFLEEGVHIFSAWQANAIPVVEFTVSQIMLANKGYYVTSSLFKKDYHEARVRMGHYVGNYGAKIGILGYGAIGSRVVKELIRHKLELYVFAPNLSLEEAEKSGIHKASLEEIFSICDVISNHLANVPETQGIVNRSLLEKIKPYSTFINTGRGDQVDEDALCDVLMKDPTICAVLDVTTLEPPAPESRFYDLPNVFLTPHIAGSLGNEVQRMGEYMFEEYHRMINGKKCLFEVTKEMLETMA